MITDHYLFQVHSVPFVLFVHTSCPSRPISIFLLPVCTTPHLSLDLVKHMVPCLKKPLTHHKKSTCCMNGILKKERTVSPWHWPTKKDCTSTYIERSSICPLQWTRSCLPPFEERKKLVTGDIHQAHTIHTRSSRCVVISYDN